MSAAPFSRKFSWVGLVCIVGLTLCSSARADVAQLRNGRALEVRGFRMEGTQVVLLMKGGGEVALPSHQVLEIRRSFLPPGEPIEASERSSTSSLAASERNQEEVDGRSLAAGEVFDREALKELAAKVAESHGVDAKLVDAVIQVESSYDPFAVSHRGAMGLMQLMPRTAARYSVENAFDPAENVEGGVRYLKELLDRYSGQTRLALAAYNAGEEAVERHSGIPPFRETVSYVSRVLREARR